MVQFDVILQGEGTLESFDNLREARDFAHEQLLPVEVWRTCSCCGTAKLVEDVEEDETRWSRGWGV
jgi:hypothetical protein